VRAYYTTKTPFCHGPGGPGWAGIPTWRPGPAKIVFCSKTPPICDCSDGRPSHRLERTCGRVLSTDIAPAG